MPSDELVEECAKLQHDTFDAEYRRLHQLQGERVEWDDLSPVNQEILRNSIAAVLEHLQGPGRGR
jgi:hypothetical protein